MLAFEDLHWADPTSLDLMRALAERGAQAPLLIVATTRPEFRPPWSLRSHHSVDFARAARSRRRSRRWSARSRPRHALSKEVVEGVSERTGGVPLFVEEVTRLLLERGEQGGVQAIPPTLQQSLAARLDRLGAAREVAQIGAVLGRDFTYSLLRDVAEARRAGAASALERLADADLLFVEGAPPQAQLSLQARADPGRRLRQPAQEPPPGAAPPRRRNPARRPERAAAEPEVIAHHFTQAGLDDLAIEWWGKAGDQALRRSAFQEAIAHLGKAIAMADKAARRRGSAAARRCEPATDAIARRLWQRAHRRARAGRAGNDGSLRQEPASRRLATRTRPNDWRPTTAFGSAATCAASCRRCGRTRRTFLSDVEARPDSPEAGVAHRAAGITHWFAGEYREARDHLERALALFQPGRDDDLAFRFGQDPGVGAMLYLALALWPLGEVDRAMSLVDDAETRIAGLAHVGTRAYGKCTRPCSN